MNKRNCPNCGAPYDINLNICPYCKTSYFDMSSIDFEYGKPMYLKLKINMGNKPAYITQKVIPRLGDITISTDTSDTTDYMGNTINRIVTSHTMVTDISFEAVPDYGKNELCQIIMED